MSASGPLGPLVFLSSLIQYILDGAGITYVREKKPELIVCNSKKYTLL